MHLDITDSQMASLPVALASATQLEQIDLTRVEKLELGHDETDMLIRCEDAQQCLRSLSCILYELTSVTLHFVLA